MKVLYDLGIFLYGLMISIASLFNSKAKLLKEGRSKVWKQLKESNIQGPTIWIHVASLGEFEQGRPIIEAIKKHSPEKKIVVTFFSPSGYEIRKNYDLADHTFYLPADTKWNAKRFIEAIDPEKVFFVKYEYWYNYLEQLQKRSVPVFGVSVILYKEKIFFKWYGKWFRRVLKFYDHFYLQDEKSAELIKSLGIDNFTVAGDTRFDRVIEIADTSEDIDIAARFSEGSRTIVAGSSWLPGEKILAEYINEAPTDVKLIIAPHVINEDHIRQIEALLSIPSFRITSPPDDVSKYRVMIVNTIGMLAAIYRYGQVAYIGGGFGKGIHNTLEAAVYGIPVIFGPKYKKYKEACDLVEEGGGFEIKTFDDFTALVNKMWDEPGYLKMCGDTAGGYVEKMCGATSIIMKDVFYVDI